MSRRPQSQDKCADRPDILETLEWQKLDIYRGFNYQVFSAYILMTGILLNYFESLKHKFRMSKHSSYAEIFKIFQIVEMHNIETKNSL